MLFEVIVAQDACNNSQLPCGPSSWFLCTRSWGLDQRLSAPSSWFICTRSWVLDQRLFVDNSDAVAIDSAILICLWKGLFKLDHRETLRECVEVLKRHWKDSWDITDWKYTGKKCWEVLETLGRDIESVLRCYRLKSCWKKCSEVLQMLGRHIESVLRCYRLKSCWIFFLRSFADAW